MIQKKRIKVPTPTLTTLPNDCICHISNFFIHPSDFFPVMMINKSIHNLFMSKFFFGCKNVHFHLLYSEEEDSFIFENVFPFKKSLPYVRILKLVFSKTSGSRKPNFCVKYSQMFPHSSEGTVVFPKIYRLHLVNLSTEMNNEFYKVLSDSIGSSVKVLKLRLFQSIDISKYFPFVEEVSFSFCGNPSQICGLESIKCLKKLTFENSPPFSNGDYSILSKLPNLYELEILQTNKWNKIVDDNYFLNLKSLKKLTLYECGGVSNEISKHLSSLEELYVSVKSQINIGIISRLKELKLFSFCPMKERLSIEDLKVVEGNLKMKELKVLIDAKMLTKLQICCLRINTFDTLIFNECNMCDSVHVSCKSCCFCESCSKDFSKLCKKDLVSCFGCEVKTCKECYISHFCDCCKNLLKNGISTLEKDLKFCKKCSVNLPKERECFDCNNIVCVLCEKECTKCENENENDGNTNEKKCCENC